jgi:hypothetical protein
MILVIDNYDSFTFNLVQYLGEMGQELKVFRNDAITTAAIAKLAPQRIVISPGPGRPENSGIIIPVIKEFSGKVPILGVCLGHQAIGAFFMMARQSSADCRARSAPPVTTLWLSRPKLFQAVSKFPPEPPMVSSWDCATAKWLSKECSFIPNRF